MSWLPWRRGREAEGAERDGTRAEFDDEPILVCRFQDGTLSCYPDAVHIERAGPSRFADKTIPREEIVDVTYETGLAIGYLQIQQVGFENDAGGFLSSPVDENTLHFGRGARECAERAAEELRFGGG